MRRRRHVGAVLLLCHMTRSLHVTRPVIVRRVVHNDAPHVSIECHLADTRRTLLRLESEVVQRGLSRLAATLSKSKKGGATKKAPPMITADDISLLDSNGDVLATSQVAVDAWSSAALLRVGEEELPILFEPAEVSELVVPCEPLVGISLGACPTLINCKAEELLWRWERSASAAAEGSAGTECSWELVGRGCEYEPTADDVGRQLRVHAKPRSNELGQSVSIGRPVAATPARPLLQRRLQEIGPRDGARARSNKFRALSYNLLADCYSRHWDDPGNIHSYCPHHVTHAPHRMQRLLEEVLAFSPDLVALQECDEKWFNALWKPHMERRNYLAFFTLKRSAGSNEGCATFVHRDAFEVVECRAVPLNLQDDTSQLPQLSTLLESQPLTRDGISSLPTVGQLLMLRGKASQRELVLVNTHLYFANPAVHVRLLQMASLLHHALALMDEHACRPALVVMGDLNSDSTDAVLRLLCDAHVSACDPDFLYGALMWSPSVGLEDNARRAAQNAASASLSLRSGASEEGDERASEPESLVAARVVALQFHRLRRSLARLRAVHDDASSALQMASEEGLVRMVQEDAAAGRSLLDSDALAAAELARQLGRSLSDARTTDAFVAGRVRLERVAEELERIRKDLTARTAAVASDIGSEIDDEITAAKLAAIGAGVAIKTPTKLTSAYGLHTSPTHVLPAYQNTLDWICYDADQLQLTGTAPLPSLEELTANVAMPSEEWPSDHVSLCCDFEWSAKEP